MHCLFVQIMRPGDLVIQPLSMGTSSNILRTTSVLLSCANHRHHMSVNMSPIYYVGHSGKPDSLLDLAFWSDSSMVASVNTLQPGSDHLPILPKTNAFGRPGADNQYAELNEE